MRRAAKADFWQARPPHPQRATALLMAPRSILKNPDKTLVLPPVVALIWTYQRTIVINLLIA